MACLTLTFLLYLLLPQLRDLTGKETLLILVLKFSFILFVGKFILGICSFLVCNYALLLINAEMLGFNDPNLEVRNLPWIVVVFEIQDAGKKYQIESLSMCKR